MTGVFTLTRMMAGALVLSLLGGAFFWHRAQVERAAAAGELRGRAAAAAAFRTQRKADISRIRRQAAQDRARARRLDTLVKDLSHVRSIDDDCHVPGDALRLLDAVGAGTPSAP